MSRWRLDDVDRLSRRRIHATFLVFILVVAATFVQLVDVQVLRAEEHAERGIRQRTRTIDLPASRGRIYDREGDVLATSVLSATIYADPRAYRPQVRSNDQIVRPAIEAADAARRLAEILGREAVEIESRLLRDAHFVYVARQIDMRLGEEIMALGIPGIGMISEPKRVYPAGGLAAQVIGFTGIDGDALQGLEARHDELLRGVPGTLSFERAIGGLAISTGLREMSPAVPGRDLVLTIDRDIQYAAERVAADITARFNADGATIVVMEIATGEILGMASAPTFDPNDRRTEEREFWRNRAVTDMFEPGSIQKTFTIAAALESGAITADTTFRVPDRYTMAGKTFSDVSKHGIETWTAADILSRSSNVGAIMIAQQAGVSTVRDHLDLLSYGRPTGLRFPGEVGGLMPARDQWWATTLPTVAIGYGTATTLLQMASLYAAVANDGVRVEPVLVRGTVGSDGNLEPSTPPISERLFSSETSRILLEMLGQAVDGEGATGTRAQIPGYRVGGKTGTAIKSLIGTGGYSDRYIASFVGVAPLDDPRLVVAVMVDGPRPVYYGGAVAAPAFAEVMHASLLARRIVPDGAGRSLQELVEVTRTMAAEDAVARAAAAELASREPASADPATTAAPDSR